MPCRMRYLPSLVCKEVIFCTCDPFCQAALPFFVWLSHLMTVLMDEGDDPSGHRLSELCLRTFPRLVRLPVPPLQVLPPSAHNNLSLRHTCLGFLSLLPACRSFNNWVSLGSSGEAGWTCSTHMLSCCCRKSSAMALSHRPASGCFWLTSLEMRMPCKGGAGARGGSD